MKKKILIIASYIILAIVFLLAGITIGKKSENRLQETEAQTLIKQKVVEASFLVVNEDSKNSISQNDLTMSDGLLQTYREIINSQTIKEKIKEKYLNIREFTPNQKREAYERQEGICPNCKEHFDISEMEGDHITPWHSGGKTNAENCQMLCRECNRRKSGI